MEEWYQEIESSEKISQGDIIFNCDVISPKVSKEEENIDSNQIILDAELFNVDVIVLTQACDLKNSKVENVLLARVIPADTEKNTVDINKGKSPRYHVLKCKTNGQVSMEYKFIDYSSLFVMPLKYLEQKKTEFGKRLRLNSPYREYVSQRFGVYYSRIGLPIDIKEIEIKDYFKQKTTK